jgi:hypothetical protein
MNYYIINWSDDLKKIGHYPQTALLKGYNPTLSNSHRQVDQFNFPDFIPNLELELHENAIPTNYIMRTGATFGIFIDEKFKNVLQQFSLPPHHFYNIKVTHKNKLLNYYWFHYIVDDFWDYFDLENSTIKIAHNLNHKNFKIKPIKSIQNLIETRTNLERGFYLIANELILKKHLPYDIFKISDGIYYSEIISETLKNSLENKQMTGFEIKPFDKIINAEKLI